EDYVALQAAPAGDVVYDLSLENGVAALRLLDGVLELLDAHGAPRIRMARPYLVDRQGIRHWADVAVTACAVDSSAAPPGGRPFVPPGSPSCGVHLRWDGASVAYPAVLDPSWSSASNMSTPREAAASALLSTGRVLVAGGDDASTYVSTASAELYDPPSG